MMKLKMNTCTNYTKYLKTAFYLSLILSLQSCLESVPQNGNSNETPSIIETPATTITYQLASNISGSTCALSPNNLAYCWGQNDLGQLGNNTSTVDPVPTPTAVNTSGVFFGKTIKSISQGGLHTCAIASDNLAYCWGYNYYGQLGNNSTTQSNIPVAVDTSGVLSGKTIKSIATGGGGHTCAIASDDLVYCWGNNTYGELGNNTFTNSSVPVAISTAGVLAGKTAKSISVGGLHTCAIASDNLLYCWGGSGFGQLGNNSTASAPVPIAVNSSGSLAGKTIKSVSTAFYFTCVIASDDLAYCWGNNNYGRLGINSTAPVIMLPTPVDTTGALAGKTIKTISASGANTCVIASDNLAYCWGYNNYGQLGNNSTTNSLVAVAVDTTTELSGKSIVSLKTGGSHSCAIASDNIIYCWGNNSAGELGNGLITNSLVPVSIIMNF